MKFRYATVTPDKLRPGDEIRAADGKAWLPPVRERGVKIENSKHWGAYDYVSVWAATKPGYGPADCRFTTHQRLRVRRTIG